MGRYPIAAAVTRCFSNNAPNANSRSKPYYWRCLIRMKKLIVSLFVLSLLLCLLPLTVLAAEEEISDGVLIEGKTITVTSQDELTAALNQTEPVASILITESFTVNRESFIMFDNAHLPYYHNVVFTIAEGVTLTVENGGSIGSFWFSFEGGWDDPLSPNGLIINNGTILVKEDGRIDGDFYRNYGEVIVERGGSAICVDENFGKVTVLDGGFYPTTQGGRAFNYGSVDIQTGGQMLSRFGSKIINGSGGTMNIDGTFYCGTIGEAGLWFQNDGIVTGNGSIIIYPDNPESAVNMDAKVETIQAAVGEAAQSRMTVLPTYTITVQNDGSGTVSVDTAFFVTPRVIFAVKDETVTLTAVPNAGYRFKEWQSEDITVSGDTFVMPDKSVTLKAVFEEEPVVSEEEPVVPELPYTDVSVSAWSYTDICYVRETGLMNGISDTEFAPQGVTTRAMIVTILWRLEGEVVVDNDMSFADVASGQWYTEAIRWAQANGIVNGYSTEQFAPDDSVTREQIATIFCRYAAFKKYDISAGTDLSRFTDLGKVNAWAAADLAWANAVGLINGVSDTELAPLNLTTREQVAAILHRFCENIITVPAV